MDVIIMLLGAGTLARLILRGIEQMEGTRRCM